MSSKAEKTRLRILESARRMLGENGYYGVGMEEVARDAGVSRQSLYLHFKSKPDLIVTLARYIDDTIKVPEPLRPIGEAKTALEVLAAGIDAYGATEPQIYDVASLVYSARRTDEAAEAAWQDRMAFRRENVRQVVERLKKEGFLADGWTVEEATDFAWALTSVHTYEYLVLERGWSVDQLVTRIKQVLRRTFVVQPPSE